MFIPIRKLEGLDTGCRVVLKKNLDLLKGRFTKGHEFTITGESQRGFDIIDADGNEAIEVDSDYFICLDKDPDYRN